MTKQFVSGEDIQSPQPGQSIFISPFLGECFVNFIIVNESLFNQLTPDPKFHHLYLQNKVEMIGFTFSLGDHVIFDVTPVKPCFV